MLGRSYMVIGKPTEGVAAYARALKLRPGEAALMADYADALAVVNGRSFDGEPAKWIAKALQADPDNLKALALAATAAFNRGDMALAVRHWDRAVKVGPADHPIVRQAVEAAAAARQQAKPAAAPK
jgi:cytochrome c-type biogenesis protein CcmH